MKIALVCDWYHPRVGGIELHLQALARHLIGAGHDVVAITPTPGAAEVDGVRVRRVDARRAPSFGFVYTRGGVRAVGDALATEQVDIAHCHVSIVSPTALAGARAAQRAGVATVVTFHSVVPQTRLLAHAANAVLGSSAWNATFTAVSARVARDVQPMAGDRRVAILPNGIDVEFWRGGAAADRSSHSDAISLVSVMRLNAKKRPLALIELMVRLRALTARTVRLRIAGEGPERGRVERAIERYGLGACVELLGNRTRAELRELFARSDLFVLPTVRESFGLAAAEARCAGLPVVAMRASGVAEVIEQERNGLLASSDADFATQVAALINDDERRRAMALRNTAEPPPFDWTRVLAAHLAVYEEALTLRHIARRVSSA